MGIGRSKREFREEGEERLAWMVTEAGCQILQRWPKAAGTRTDSPESLSPPQSLDRSRKKGSWEEQRGLQRGRRDRGTLGEADSSGSLFRCGRAPVEATILSLPTSLSTPLPVLLSQLEPRQLHPHCPSRVCGVLTFGILPA